MEPTESKDKDKVKFPPWHILHREKDLALKSAGWTMGASGNYYKEPGQRGVCWSVAVVWSKFNADRN